MSDQSKYSGKVLLADGWIDMRLGEVHRSGEMIRLTSKELELLAYLYEHAGELVTQDQLLIDVWGYTRPPVTRAVYTAVKRLRVKIEADTARPVHVLTVHGEGYRFVRALEERNDAAPLPSEATPPPREAETQHLEEARPLAPLPPSSAPKIRRSLSAFVGRSEELDALAQRYGQGERMLTLRGTGGMGKTRIAREFGLTLQEDESWQGGVWFVDCAEALDARALIRNLSSAVGHAAQPDVASEDLLRSLILWARRSGSTFLILDNLEQCIEPARDVLAQLLSEAPEVSILVTSRQRLGIQGERVIEIGPLGEAEAITLLLDRSGDMQTLEDLEPGEHARLRALVEGLDAMPLAIELAAAWLEGLGSEALLNRLGERFRFLRGASSEKGADVTLRGTLETSWALLDDEESCAFAELSVFHGGFDLHAAEAVLSAEWAPEVIRRLRERSLLTLDRRQPGKSRFEMYESVRAYGWERLNEGEPEAVITRHREWCKRRLSQLLGEMRLGQAEAIGSINRDIDNIIAALRYALTSAPGEALVLLRMLAPHTQELRLGNAWLLELLTQALEAYNEESDALSLSCRVLCVSLLDSTTPYAQKRTELIEAQTLADEKGEALVAATALSCLASVANAHAEVEDGIAMGEAACERLGALKGREARDLEVRTLNTLCALYSLKGDRETARSQAERARDLAVAHKYVTAEVYSRYLLVELETKSAKARPRAIYEGLELTRLFGKMGLRAQQTKVLCSLATVWMHHGKLEEAEGHATEALMLSRDLGMSLWEGHCLMVLGMVKLDRADLEASEHLLSQSREIHAYHEHRMMLGYARSWLGLLCAERGDHGEALRLFDEALVGINAESNRYPASQIETVRAVTIARSGDTSEGRKVLSEVAEFLERTHATDTLYRLALAEVGLLNALKLEGEGEHKRAGGERAEALESCKDILDVDAQDLDKAVAALYTVPSRVAARRILKLLSSES